VFIKVKKNTVNIIPGTKNGNIAIHVNAQITKNPVKGFTNNGSIGKAIILNNISNKNGKITHVKKISGTIKKNQNGNLNKNLNKLNWIGGISDPIFKNNLIIIIQVIFYIKNYNNLFRKNDTKIEYKNNPLLTPLKTVFVFGFNFCILFPKKIVKGLL